MIESICYFHGCLPIYGYNIGNFAFGMPRRAWPHPCEWNESNECIYLWVNFWDTVNLLFSMILDMHEILEIFNFCGFVITCKNQLQDSTHCWENVDSLFRITLGIPRYHLQALHKKWNFLLRISSVNVAKSTGKYGFGHSYWGNP